MDEAVERLKTLATTTVSDTLDRLGISGQCFGIEPLDPSFRLYGRAFTMRTVPVPVGGGTIRDYIDDVPAGSVVAIDNGGRLDATVWGGFITRVAAKRGLSGTVIDGVCRNKSESLELGYPIFSRGTWMRTGRNRVHLDATEVIISIGGVRVGPGDLLLGDADGVLVVPHGRESEVLALASEIDASERTIRLSLDGGMRLDEAKKKHKHPALRERKS